MQQQLLPNLSGVMPAAMPFPYMMTPGNNMMTPPNMANMTPQQQQAMWQQQMQQMQQMVSLVFLCMLSQRTILSIHALTVNLLCVP